MERIHVFANGDRGIAVLRALAAAGHGVKSLIVAAGKSNQALSKAASDLGINILTAEDVNNPNFVCRLAGFPPKLFIVSGFSSILQRPLFSLPELGTVNLHAGRLPEYRGGSPLNWQMINGEDEAGISVLKVDDGIDTGDILAEARIPIGDDDTILDLHTRANELFPKLVVDVVERLEAGTIQSQMQNEAQASYWHQRNDVDGGFDPRRMSASEVVRFVRALTRPYPGAWVRCRDHRVRVLAARVPEFVVRGNPGRVLFLQRKGPFLVCADRAVLLCEYAVEGATDERLRHGDGVYL